MTHVDVKFKVDTKIMKQIMRNTPERIEEFLDKEAESVVNTVELSMQQSPASGRSYPRGAKTHVASSKGNPPRVDLGSLINAIRWDRDGQYRRVIYDAMGYGGGRHGGYWQFLELGMGMGARPSLGPAFEKERREFEDHAVHEGLIKP